MDATSSRPQRSTVSVGAGTAGRRTRRGHRQATVRGVAGANGLGAQLAVLVALAAVVATGCLRLNVGIVVHDADEMSVSARVTMPPLLLSLVGGEEALEEAIDLGEILASDLPLGGDLDPFGDSAEPRIVGDSDGWRGIEVEATGPLDSIDGIGLDAPDIEQMPDGWRFSWQTASAVPMAGGEDDSFPPLGGDFPEMFEDAFRFTVSVSLPGRLDHTNSTLVRTRDGMTTARWTISDLEAPVDFVLVTDTSPEAGSRGLGAGAIVGIAVGSSAVVVLAGLWWWIRRTRRGDENVRDHDPGAGDPNPDGASSGSDDAHEPEGP